MLRSCSMVWNVDVLYLNVWGNPLPIAAVPENANTTNVTSLQSVWLIEYHGSLYYLIKGNRKIIFKKNCNNPPWKCFLSKVFGTCRCGMQLEWAQPLHMLPMRTNTLDRSHHFEFGTFLNRRHYCDIWYGGAHFSQGSPKAAGLHFI